MQKPSAFVILLAAGLWFTGLNLAAAETPAAPATDPTPTDQPITAPAPTLPSAHEIDATNGTPAIPSATLFPILPFDAEPDTPPQLLPLASNMPLDNDHTGVTRAIIVIHDVSRDSSSALAMLATLAGERNKTTFIMAPQFLLESDIARFAGHLPDEGRALARWTPGTWEDGGDSTAQPPQKGISSFAALDLLLVFVSEKKFFPDLKDVVVIGHGAGADFVLRYAAVGLAPDLLDPLGIKVQFASANASSYLYFTSMRPLGNKPGFGLPSTEKCPAYNSYKYGLDNLNVYARRTGANEIRLRYISRYVTYLVGKDAGQDDRFPDNNCAAMLQGIDRLARAANYDVYLSTIFSDEADQSQKSVVIAGAGYDPLAMFGSACGMSILFGDGECGEASIVGTEPAQ